MRDCCSNELRLLFMGKLRIRVEKGAYHSTATIRPGFAYTNGMKHFTPKEAQEFLQGNPTAVLIDCRSEFEYLFVGHPAGAILVPWYDGIDWALNSHFVGQVRMAASHDRPVILICRSGNRSREAGQALEASGFTQVYNVLHGFEGELDDGHHRGSLNGWRHDGLPWEQC